MFETGDLVYLFLVIFFIIIIGYALYTWEIWEILMI